MFLSQDNFSLLVYSFSRNLKIFTHSFFKLSFKHPLQPFLEDLISGSCLHSLFFYFIYLLVKSSRFLLIGLKVLFFFSLTSPPLIVSLTYHFKGSQFLFLLTSFISLDELWFLLIDISPSFYFKDC